MAGSYADVPGHRMAYDRDGTVGVVVRIDNSTVQRQLTGAEMQTINNESANEETIDTGSGTDPGLVFLFPEPRDVDGWIFQAVYSGTASVVGISGVETTTDSTNGVDGTWTQQVSSPPEEDYDRAELRNEINAASWSGVTGVRFALFLGLNDEIRVSGAHLYGSPSSGEATDRLRIWHPTSDAEVGGAYLDWGDIARVSTNTRDIRVKNPSSQTAENVTLTTEALTDTTPSITAGYEFSIGGGAYAASLNIGDISAGAISGVVTVRRTVPSDATLSLWWPRIVASASSWT